MTERMLRLGVAGFGVAGRAMAAEAATHERVELVAIADPRTEPASVADGVTTWSSTEEMYANVLLDAVYVATPTWTHRFEVVEAVRHARAVVVEKPMAASMHEADNMVQAAHAAGAVLLVGHSQSFEAPVRAIRDVITSGRLGPVRFITALNHTDWMNRPRPADDFDTSLGGGVSLRQGSHHFDIVRYLAGGMIRTVRASVGYWDSTRRGSNGAVVDGAYSAFVEFADGAVATVTYSGYGRFPATELTGGITETGRRVSLRPRSVESREQLTQPGEFPPTFGFLLVSCEHGDMRIDEHGVVVYGSDGVDHLPVATRSGRHAVLDELADASSGVRKPVHDGAWGLATLEACLSVLESGRTGRTITLSRQCRLRDDDGRA